MWVTTATKQTSYHEVVLLYLMTLNLVDLQRALFPPPPLQDSPIKGVTKRGGILQSKCQLSSCMETAENSGGKDL